MEVVEIYVFRPKTLIKPLNTNYFFYWRSGGGRNALLIIPTSEIENYRNAYGCVSTRELPRGLEFLEHLKKYIGLDYRDLGNVVEIATHVPGKIIGKKGKNIKMISRMVGKRVKVTEAILVHYDFIDKCWRMARKEGNTWVISSDDPVVQIDESKLFEYTLDPSHGYAIKSGYIAPWHL